MASKILKAASRADLEFLGKNLDKINVQNKKGETALHVAVSEDLVEVVEFLVRNGADVEKKEKKNGFTPFMLCLAEKPLNYVSMMRTLLSSGIDLKTQDNAGETAFHLACQFNLEEAIECLLEEGADVEIKNKRGLRPLHIAASRCDTNILDLLLTKGKADINAVDPNGNTALHWVFLSQRYYPETAVEFLLKRGAKFVGNEDGDTPLHCDAMHCDVNTPWPTKGGAVIIAADAKYAAMKNRDHQTAQGLLRSSMSTILKEEQEEEMRRKKAAMEAKKKEQEGPKLLTVEEAFEKKRELRRQERLEAKKKEAADTENASKMVVFALVAFVIALILLVLSFGMK